MRCRAPELPLSMAGTVEVRVLVAPESGKSTSSGLRRPWRYLPPPAAYVDPATVAVGGRAGPPLWLANGSAASLSFRVYNVAPSTGRALSGLLLGAATGGGLGYFQVGYDVIVTYSVRDAGSVDPEAGLMVVLAQQDNPGDSESSAVALPPVGLEVRDPRLPRVAALAPSAGPGAAGWPLLLGVTSGYDLRWAAGGAAAACVFGVGADEHAAEVRAVVSLAEWTLSCGQVGQLAGDPSSVISEDLGFQFQSACLTTYDAGEQAGTRYNYLVFVRSPAVELPFGDMLAQIEISVGQTQVSVDYLLLKDPDGPALAVARTQNNDLKSDLAGDVSVAVTLTNFAVVATDADVGVVFGPAEVPVQRLVSSDFQQTKLTVVVPAAEAAGTVMVTVYPKRLPSNYAHFSFQYVQDDNPVVVDFSPEQVYCYPGGTMVEVRLLRFPRVQQASIFVQIQNLDAVIPPFPAHSVSYDDNITTVAFAIPSSTMSGKASFSILIPQLFKETAPVMFDMLQLPSTRARIGGLIPSTGPNQGGIWISADLVNLRMTNEYDRIIVNVTLKSGWYSELCTVISTTPILTKVSFLLPPFEQTGISSVKLWILGESRLAASADFLYYDAQAPQLLFSYPSGGYAGKMNLVEVSVSRFGYDWKPAALHVVSNDCFTGNVIDIREVQNGSALLSVEMLCLNVCSSRNVSLKNCSLNDSCADSPLIQFVFECKDPVSSSILYYQPNSSTTDGSILLNITLNHLPYTLQNTSKIQLRMVFSRDRATLVLPLAYVSLTFQTGNSAGSDKILEPSGADLTTRGVILSFEIPEAPNRTAANGITLFLECADSCFAPIPLSGKFSYLVPLPLQIVSVIPTMAARNITTYVSISVYNFPKVRDISDIVVQFTAPGMQEPVFAVVRSFSQDSTTSIVFEAPRGSSTPSGYANLMFYHLSYLERTANFSGFLFVDGNSPDVISIFSDAGGTGLKFVSVPRSIPTKVTVIIGQATLKPAALFLGDIEVGMTLSDVDSATKTARVTFYIPASTCQMPCPILYGLVLFSKDCFECTNSSCCEQSSCSKRCGSSCESISACFSFTYLDDSMPSILFQSIYSGPSSGGTSIRLKISNFPIATSGSDFSVLFLDKGIVGSVFVIVSSDYETEVIVTTPAVDLNGTQSITYAENMLIANSRPSKVLRFPFTFTSSPTELLSVFPTSGGKAGGTLVVIKVMNFPVAASIGILFGGVNIPSDSIRLLPSSDSQLATISFYTLQTESGEVVCRIFPKQCPIDCGQDLTFNFYQTEELQFLDPLPKQCVLFASPCQLSVRMKNFPSNGNGKALFQNMFGKETTTIVQFHQSGAITMAIFDSPPQTGNFICSLTVSDLNANATLRFTYVILDSTAPQVTGVEPTLLSTNFDVSGVGKIKFRSTLSIVVSNFPPGIAKDDILFGCQGDIGDVLSIQILGADPSSDPEIGNRTRIVMSAPSRDIPGTCAVQSIVRAPIFQSNSSRDPMGILLASPLNFNITYIYPCSFESFCFSNSLVLNVNKILQTPPSSNVCSIDYCMDPMTVSDPELVSVFPTEGPSSGGTLVQLTLRNFPIISNQSIRVLLDAGGHQIETKAFYVSDTDTLVSAAEAVTLAFITTRVPRGDLEALGNVGCAVVLYLGSVRKSVPFFFQFTPIVQSAPRVLRIFPSSIVSGIESTVYVTVENFPRLSVEDSVKITSKAMCSDNKTFSGADIVDSTYLSTDLRLRLNISFKGPCRILIFLDTNGEADAGTFDLLVTPQVHPAVQFWYPLVGQRGETVTVSVSFLPPNLGQKDFSVLILNCNLTVNLSSVYATGPANCTSPDCTKYSLELILPNVTELPNTLTIRITAGVESVPFELTTYSEKYPTIVSITPDILDVTKTDLTEITLFLSNAVEFCRNVTACKVMFGFAEGSIIKSEIQGYQRILNIRPPKLRDDSILACTLSDGNVALEFCGSQLAIGLKLMPPPLLAEPIDFPCSGGTRITISAIGWSLFKTAESIHVVFGNKNGTDLQLGKVKDNEAGYSTMIFSALVPRLGSVSASLQGYVVVDGSDFKLPILFECFEEPIASVQPSISSLDGKLVSVVNIVRIELRSFPSIFSLGDLRLTFADNTCDGINCSIVSIQNTDSSVILGVTVPASSFPKATYVTAFFNGKAGLPAGGDQNVTYIRTARMATTPFVYSLRAPSIITAQFCLVCNVGPLCIVNNICGGSQGTPWLYTMTKSGAGTAVIVIENIRQIPLDISTGAVQSPAAMYVNFGVSFGIIKKVIYSDSYGMAIEVSAATPLPAGRLSSSINVQPDVSSSFVQSVQFEVNVIDDSVGISCLDGCAGPSVLADELIISLTGIHLSPSAVSDMITVRFGDLLAISVRFLQSTESKYVFAVDPPNYTCSNCIFNSGSAQVPVRILDSGSSQEIARINYTFWGPPKFQSAVFNSAGTSLYVTFDQATNRALINGTQFDCAQIFISSEMGSGSQCSWQDDYKLTVLFAQDASLVPGSILVVNTSASLRSKNGISPDSVARVVVTAPIFVPLVMSLSGVGVVDLCSPLDLRAFVPSPRPIIYTWSCLNDAYLDAFLVSNSGPVLSLSAGTPQMQSIGKTYIIAVSARNFLGQTSNTATFQVLKKSSPAPPVEFTPPSVTITRDRPLLISGLADFSACPGGKDSLIFDWRLISGPDDFSGSNILASKTPQIYIPSMTLTQGSTYVLALRTTFRQDSSTSSDSYYQLIIGYRPLVAVIAGLSTIQLPADKSLLLSAESSYDPDETSDSLSDGSNQLMYSWSCTSASAVLGGACRDSSGIRLDLPQFSHLQISPGKLAPSYEPYVFQLSVSKAGKLPAAATVQVYVMPQKVPQITAQLTCSRSSSDQRPCCTAANGALLANSDSKFVVSAFSDTVNTSFECFLLSSLLSNVSIDTVRLGSNVFILQGSASTLFQGNTYVLRLIGSIDTIKTSKAEADIFVNYPPTGGTFTGCLIQNDVGKCVTVGLSLLDTFRLECNSWTDPEGDLLLSYRFGYSVGNTSLDSSSIQWFDWSRNSIKDVFLPTGQITVLAQVQDDCGGQTTFLTFFLSVIDSSQSGALGRRLLISGGFWDAARGKVQSALQTFRADKVNQLVTSISFELGVQLKGSVDPVVIKDMLIQALRISVDQSTHTSGYVCEALSAVASISNSNSQPSAASLPVIAELVYILTGPTVDSGAVSSDCATKAAIVVANVLKATSQFSRFLAVNLQDMISGFGKFANQRMVGSMPGESRVLAVGSELFLMTVRGAAGDLQSHILSQARSATLLAGIPLITFPIDFVDYVINNSRASVDAQVQFFAHPPPSDTFSTVSGLYGFSISDSYGEIISRSLHNPLKISILLDVDFIDKSITNISHLECRQWFNNSYVNGICKIFSVLFRDSKQSLQITCSCSHIPISMLAIGFQYYSDTEKQNSTHNMSYPSGSPSPNAARNHSGQSITANPKLLPLPFPEPKSKEELSIDSSVTGIGGSPSSEINLVLYAATCIGVLTLFIICWIRCAYLRAQEIKAGEAAKVEDISKDGVFVSDLVIFCPDG